MVFEPYERLAWDGHGIGLHVYHAWLIHKTDFGCTVQTEEVQNGWVAKLGRTLRPNRMEDQHQIWLEALCKKADEGLPPIAT